MVKFICFLFIIFSIPGKILAEISAGTSCIYQSVDKSSAPVIQASDEENGSWRLIGNYPPEKIGLNEIVFTGKDKLFTGFGTGKGGWRYSVTENTWTPVPDISRKTESASFAQSDKYGYVCFGQGNRLLWQFDITTNDWSQIDSFPGTPKTKALSFLIGDQIFFVGGYDIRNSNTGTSAVASKEFWQYDLKKSVWQQLPDCPLDSCFDLPVVVKDNIAYLLYKQRYVWRYQPNKKDPHWEPYDTLQVSLATSQGTLLDGKICYMTENSSNSASELWEYAVNSKKTAMLSAFPGVANEKFILSVVANDIIVLGGQRNGNASTECWLFNKDMPLAPDDLKSDSVTFRQVSLSWTDRSDKETGYIIERSTSSVFSPLDTLPVNSIQYNDIHVKENTTYLYRVKAINSSVSSDYSNTIVVKTALSLPLAPGSFQAVPKNESAVILNWKDNAFNENKYYIERSDNGIDYLLIDSLSENASSYYDTKNLKEDHLFFYRIYCSNEAGRSDFATVSVKTPESYPLPPVRVSSQALSESEISLTWDDTAFNETKYFIERSVHDNYQYYLVDSLPANVTLFKDSNLHEDETYFYRIFTSNTRGRSGYSDEVFVRTLQSLPAAPQNLSVRFDETQHITLNWEDRAFNETKYLIQVFRDSISEFSSLDSVDANKTTFVDTRDAEPEKSYKYRVCAINKRGKSAFSNVSEVFTMNAPEDLTVEPISATKLKLAWRDRSSYETGFVVSRKLIYNDPFFVQEIIDTLPSNTTEFVDTFDLRPKSLYAYSIFAINGNGSSAQTSEVRIATTTPTGVFNQVKSLSLIYPNPCTSGFYLNLTAGERNGIKVTITDDSGRLKKRLFLNQGNQEINVTDFSRGLYFVKVESAGNCYIQKVFKQ